MFSHWLGELTGMAIFDGRLFRAGAAAFFSILAVLLLMPPYIRWLQKLDATADFDKSDQGDSTTKGTSKKSPPIMGGLLLIVVILVSGLLFAYPNGYVISTLLIMVAYSAVGAVDDIAKIRNKRLVTLGKLSQKDYQDKADGISATLRLCLYFLFSLLVALFIYKFIPELEGYLTLPFISPEIWHPRLANWAFVLFISFLITATANGTNFTDGLDSLVTVPILTSMAFTGLVAYFSGNFIFAEYLHIPFLPGVDELFPLAAAIAGALLAYLWFNSPPAQIYMGDAGSIGLGGVIGIMFILVQAGLFLPIVGFIIIVEALSVVLQIGYFKISGGKRIFLCAPIHHHYQMKWKNDYPTREEINSKIVWRMHLVSLFALIFGLVLFFKVR